VYDKAGNILSITDATPDSGVGGWGTLERDFEYDALYRLLSASGREYKPSDIFWNDTTRSDDPTGTTAYTQNYEYDLMGNINVLQHTGYNSFTREFTYHDNKLNSIDVGSNTFSFSYDDCGNQIQENSERLFEWDYADRMRLFYNQTSSGNEPSVYTHYLYDAGGNRVKKFTRTSGGNWQSTTYMDGIIEYTEDDSSHIGSISHIMDDSKRMATMRDGYDFGDSTPAIKYNLDDHLGSSNVSVDDTGALVSFEEYYPFGETSFGSYGKKRYRFCGKEKDEESGLYYYGARYYSPWTCRFVSVDPLAGKYAFYTPYQYAGNKPIISIDRDGLEETGKSPQQNSTDSSSTNNTPAVSDSTSTNITDTICTSTKTDSTDAVKPKPAPKPQAQKATPEKKITGIKLDYSFKSLPGEGINSTDFKLYSEKLDQKTGYSRYEYGLNSKPESSAIGDPFDGKMPVSSGWLRSNGKKHGAFDYAVKEGTPIHSPAQGTITIASTSAKIHIKENYGNFIVINHGVIKDGEFKGMTLYSLYGHFSEIGSVKSGDKVNVGDVLGLSGKTGHVTGKNGEHLHWEIFVSSTNSTNIVNGVNGKGQTNFPNISKTLIHPDKFLFYFNLTR
jgi:RHS repeat-associated protein